MQNQIVNSYAAIEISNLLGFNEKYSDLNQEATEAATSFGQQGLKSLPVLSFDRQPTDLGDLSCKSEKLALQILSIWRCSNPDRDYTEFRRSCGTKVQRFKKPHEWGFLNNNEASI